MNSLAQFNIQIGDDLTWNVQPILHEVRHALKHLNDTGETTMIDLRSIPLAPGEEQKLIDTLGRGEVHAGLNALGPSEIIESRFAGVWLVTHYNEENSIISRFIEITEFPDILKSQREDMIAALDTLEQQLTSGQLTETTETTSEADQ